MRGYEPPPASCGPTKEEEEAINAQSLGKWFPTASVIKSSVCYSNDKVGGSAGSARSSLLLFYQYVSPPWSQSTVTNLMSHLARIARDHRTNVGGRIRVSTEGVNCTISAASTPGGSEDPSFEAARTLRHLAEDLRRFDPDAFSSTDWKYIDGLSADRHFKELKLIPVKELVFYKIREEDCAGVKMSGGAGGEGDAIPKGEKEVKGGIHLEAKDYHEMLKREDAVVIDVRNHYEAAIGRFDGQTEAAAMSNDADPDNRNDVDDAVGTKKKGGATYIDPKMRKSTDFTSWLAEPETKKKLEGKTVMMFCTGGIRCERASAYLNTKMGEDVKGVYQLQGGIERYLQAFPEGGFWRGKNFVFDKREAVGAGNFNGDGGVVRTRPGGGTGGGDEKLPAGAECSGCGRPWDRYVGKRKCYTCGVPVLVCDACMSGSAGGGGKKRKKKKKGEEGGKGTSDGGEGRVDVSKLRCPLCKDEGITVPADDVEFTDNGVRGRSRDPSGSSGKASKSVLKWGGGHASDKKERRRRARGAPRGDGGTQKMK